LQFDKNSKKSKRRRKMSMLFLVKTGEGNLWHKNSFVGHILGVVEADSKEKGAKKLNLIKWDGWKQGGLNAPELFEKYISEFKIERADICRKNLKSNLKNWKDYFFLPREIAKIKNKSFGKANEGIFIRVFTLKHIRYLKNIDIPKEK
jgi:hypothetical protein